MEASNERVGATWAQLATVRCDSSGPLSGRPANRTINVRSADATGVWFVSDLRSGKADDIFNGGNQYGELCWYFPERKMQFRLSGTLQVDEGARSDLWRELSAEQRAWWALPAPGSAVDGVMQKECQNVLEGEMPAHFCVIQLEVDFVDLLDQKPRPMRREMHSKDGASEDWSVQLVYP